MSSASRRTALSGQARRPRDASAGSGDVWDNRGDWVRGDGEHDRRRARTLNGLRSCWALADDDVHRQPAQLGSKLVPALGRPRIAILNDEILPVDETQLSQLAPELCVVVGVLRVLPLANKLNVAGG